MDVDAAAQHLLSVIFMERRVTPADLRDFTQALKEACDKVEQETATFCLGLVQTTEPHRFAWDDGALEIVAATLQKVSMLMAGKYNLSLKVLDRDRSPEPVSFALRQAAEQMELAVKEDDDAGTVSEAGGENLDRGGYLPDGRADRSGQDSTRGGGPGRHSDHAE